MLDRVTGQACCVLGDGGQISEAMETTVGSDIFGSLVVMD
jgi:hypothetical protein